jgi:hypothetical protein
MFSPSKLQILVVDGDPRIRGGLKPKSHRIPRTTKRSKALSLFSTSPALHLSVPHGYL